MKLLIIVASILFFASTTIAQPPEDKSIEQDFLAAIDNIAAKWGVPRIEVTKKGLSLLLDAKDISKGGVGIIRGDVYVVTRSPKNEVFAGKDKFVGTTFDTPEIFVFSRGKFVGNIRLPMGGDDDVLFALFTPKKIRIFDWKEFIGFYYTRWPE